MEVASGRALEGVVEVGTAWARVVGCAVVVGMASERVLGGSLGTNGKARAFAEVARGQAVARRLAGGPP